MENVHSIIIIKKDNKFLNYYNEDIKKHNGDIINFISEYYNREYQT